MNALRSIIPYYSSALSHSPPLALAATHAVARECAELVGGGCHFKGASLSFESVRKQELYRILLHYGPTSIEEREAERLLSILLEEMDEVGEDPKGCGYYRCVYLTGTSYETNFFEPHLWWILRGSAPIAVLNHRRDLVITQIPDLPLSLSSRVRLVQLQLKKLQSTFFQPHCWDSLEAVYLDVSRLTHTKPNASGHCLAALRSFASLKFVDLSVGNGDGVLEALKGCVGLRFLCLRDISPGQWACLEDMTQLRFFTCSGIPGMDAYLTRLPPSLLLLIVTCSGILCRVEQAAEGLTHLCRLQYLDLTWCLEGEIEPLAFALAHMPAITTLRLENNSRRVSTVGMSAVAAAAPGLKGFFTYDTKFSHVEWLSSLPHLDHLVLELRGGPVSDIRSLAALAQLTSLCVLGGTVRDWDVLAHCPLLESVHFVYVDVDNLDFVRHLQHLKEIIMELNSAFARQDEEGNDLEVEEVPLSLAPLACCPVLEKLVCQGSEVVGVHALKVLTQLKRITICATVLDGCPLQMMEGSAGVLQALALRLNDHNDHDLTPLASLTALQSVLLTHVAPGTDLAPLSSCRSLQFISVQFNGHAMLFPYLDELEVQPFPATRGHFKNEELLRDLPLLKCLNLPKEGP